MMVALKRLGYKLTSRE
jgi:sugar diacid utilization regulator